MAPKSAQKSKAPPAEAPEPKTPQSKSKRKAPAESPPPASPTPRKKVKKEPLPTSTLQQDSRAAVPIDATYEGEPVAQLVKHGKFGLSLKLEALGAFNLVKTLVFTEGEFEGHQAIILKPAKAFEFARLPEEVRKRVYKFYFAASGIVGKEIVLEGRRPDKDIYAKSYAEGSKSRVALLAVNKAIYEEAAPILYETALRLESTTTLVDFISQSEESLKSKLNNIEIKNFVKTQSRNALNNLSNCPNITRLHIDTGVSGDGEPVKAAKTFWLDASKFLEAASARMGEKGAGVEVLSFGRQAFTSKEGKGTAQPWPEEMRKEFIEELKGKMK
ncbi:uncharacterized protein LTR77_003650 [Saxophila tyrrhenica]|uniref:Uncharacterized protein n=1 Tax=Saxophila tyrrhenica TaxID=1690608 RepID=A0AAV9PE69_9PEZI|nr:hypothetical protein LTR77_003650 [Saxophila tyrrhenica]